MTQKADGALSSNERAELVKLRKDMILKGDTMMDESTNASFA